VEHLIEKASVLIEALPYIKAFFGKTVVIKYGGKAMVDEELKRSVILDVILMHYVGMRPILVHGGGPQIDQAMKRAGLEPQRVGGLRITDPETMRIVEQVLVGEINQEIVSLVNHYGGLAVGLSGKDGGLIRAKKASMIQDGEEVDLGLVGEVQSISPAILKVLEREGFIPVVAPTGFGEDGLTYNINADTVAGELAAALSAEKLVLLTDTDGILDKEGRLLSTVSRGEIEQLILDGTIAEGMLPKVQACLTALNGGVRKTHIINGTIPHALLLEIFTTTGIGTEIVQ